MVAENLYLLSNPQVVFRGGCETNQYKIGIHSGKLNRLYSRYRTSIPSVIIQYFVKNVDARKLEQDFLKKYQDCRVKHTSGKASNQIVAQLFIVTREGHGMTGNDYGRTGEKIFNYQSMRVIDAIRDSSYVIPPRLNIKDTLTEEELDLWDGSSGKKKLKNLSKADLYCRKFLALSINIKMASRHSDTIENVYIFNSYG
jgi:hypothetical protein